MMPLSLLALLGRIFDPLVAFGRGSHIGKRA